MLSESQSAPDSETSRLVACAFAFIYYTLEDRALATLHSFHPAGELRVDTQTAERDSGVNEKVNTPKRERERMCVRVCAQAHLRTCYSNPRYMARDAGERENWFARWNSIQDRKPDRLENRRKIATHVAGNLNVETERLTRREIGG